MGRREYKLLGVRNGDALWTQPSSIQRLRPIKAYLPVEHKSPSTLAPRLPRVTGLTDRLVDTAGHGEDRVN